MIKFAYTLIAILLVTSCAVAQPGQWSTKNKKAIKYVERGLEEERGIDMETGLPNYRGGIYWFDKAIDKDPNFIEAYLYKGDFAIMMGDNETAIEAYSKVIEINPEYSKTGFIYAELAMLEWSVGKYADALEHGKKFKTYKAANPDMLKEIEWLIVNCEFAVKAIANPVPFEPINVGAGVNTPDPEYFPTLTVDQSELLFTRRIVSANGSWQEDFFVAQDFEGYWGRAEPMPNNINTAFNEGAPTFAPDGTLFISNEGKGLVSKIYSYAYDQGKLTNE